MADYSIATALQQARQAGQAAMDAAKAAASAAQRGNAGQADVLLRQSQVQAQQAQQQVDLAVAASQGQPQAQLVLAEQQRGLLGLPWWGWLLGAGVVYGGYRVVRGRRGRGR